MNLNAEEHPLALSFLMNEDLYLLKEKKEEIIWDYWGDNKRFVLILHEDKNAKYIQEADKEFLLKILAALKLGQESIALVNIEQYSQLNWSDLQAFFASNKVLLFGVEGSRFGQNDLPEYQPQTWGNVGVLAAPALSVLKDDVAAKAKLWTALKTLFHVA